LTQQVRLDPPLARDALDGSRFAGVADVLA